MCVHVQACQLFATPSRAKLKPLSLYVRPAFIVAKPYLNQQQNSRFHNLLESLVYLIKCELQTQNRVGRWNVEHQVSACSAAVH